MSRTDTGIAVGDVDVRGFDDALEPVRRKHRWRLDKLMAGLTGAQRALAETDAQLETLRRDGELQAAAAAQALSTRLDPGAHRRALGYLAHLRERSLALAQQRAEQQRACDELRQQCMAQQLRIEGLERHKDEALRAYADEVRQRASAEQDRDWLARSVAGAAHWKERP